MKTAEFPLTKDEAKVLRKAMALSWGYADRETVVFLKRLTKRLTKIIRKL